MSPGASPARCAGELGSTEAISRIGEEAHHQLVALDARLPRRSAHDDPDPSARDRLRHRGRAHRPHVHVRLPDWRQRRVRERTARRSSPPCSAPSSCIRCALNCATSASIVRPMRERSDALRSSRLEHAHQRVDRALQLPQLTFRRIARRRSRTVRRVRHLGALRSERRRARGEREGDGDEQWSVSGGARHREIHHECREARLRSCSRGGSPAAPC